MLDVGHYLAVVGYPGLLAKSPFGAGLQPCLNRTKLVRNPQPPPQFQQAQ